MKLLLSIYIGLIYFTTPHLIYDEVIKNEPLCKKTSFSSSATTKMQISCAIIANHLSASIFTTQIIHSLFFVVQSYKQLEASRLL